jgi:adenylate cyclase
MTKNETSENEVEAYWKKLLDSGETPKEKRFRNIFARLPQDPRCKLCNSPYQGIGAPLMRVLGRTPSNLTPNICKW